MPFDFTDARTLIWVATAGYLVGFLLAGSALLRRQRYLRWLMFVLISGSWAIQTAGLTIRGYEVQACPLGNPFEILQFIIWTSVGLYILLFPIYRISLLGFFTTVPAGALGLLSLLVPGWDRAYSGALFGGNPWIELHAALAIFSYGIFGVLALISCMFVLQQFGLKRKHSQGLFRFLPSIRELDTVGLRLLGAGFIVLTVAIFVGSLYWIPNFANVSLPKLLFTLLVWAGYSFTLFMRLRKQLLSTHFAWTCVALFGLALLSLWPIDTSRTSPAETTGYIARAVHLP